MSDNIPDIRARRRSKQRDLPKYYEDEPPRKSAAELLREKREAEGKELVEFSPVQLLPAPPEEPSAFEKAVRFAYGMENNVQFGAGGQVIIENLTEEQDRLMQQFIWGKE